MAIKERNTQTSAKQQERGPQLSRDMALFWLDGIDEQFNNIAAIAIGGLRYQETRLEEYKDPVMRGLLHIIQQQADDSTHASNELRAMFETLPKDPSNGDSDKEINNG